MAPGDARKQQGKTGCFTLVTSEETVMQSVIELDSSGGDWQAVLPADGENREHHLCHMNTDERALLPVLPSHLAATFTAEH